MSAPLNEAQKLDLSCPDWLDRLKAGEPPVADLELNTQEAENAVSIFNKIRLPDVPGQPEMRDAAGDWSRALVSNVFGTVKTNSNGITIKRSVRKFLVLIPKKNAKTTTGAAIMLVALLKNQRPRGEFLLIGPTHAIAETAFSQAVGMINADPDNYLQSRFKVTESKREIYDTTNGAVLKIKTFDSKVVTGVKPVGILIDELHELGKISGAAKVMTQLRGGIIANPEAFIIYITTQSDDAPAGVFKSELEFGRDIRDGNATGDMLPILYEFPLEMQKSKDEPWKNADFWHFVLPNLGKSITLDVLQTEFSEALLKGKEELSLWLSQHLNIQIGLGMHRDRWRGADHWDAATDNTLDLYRLMDRSEVAVMGIDGGGLDDLFGLSIMGRCKKTSEWLLWSHAWAHEDVFERRAIISEQLKDFEKDGSLTICDYPTAEVDGVADYAEQLQELGLLPEGQAIGLDPYGVAAVIDELVARGIAEPQLAAIPQGVRLSQAVWGMERALKSGKLKHCGQPLMAWCVGNAKAEQRGNAVLITKQAAGKAKIDPLISSLNAFTLMSRNPYAANSNTSPWEEQGFSITA